MKNQVNGYTLVNEEKLNRAVYGTVGREGKLDGGVGEDATELEVITEYDRLGGLILKNGHKVKIGSFYDFEGRKPRKEPEVSFMTEIDGEIVEVTEEEAEAIKTAKSKKDEIKKSKQKKIDEENGETKKTKKADKAKK